MQSVGRGRAQRAAMGPARQLLPMGRRRGTRETLNDTRADAFKKMQVCLWTDC